MTVLDAGVKFFFPGLTIHRVFQCLHHMSTRRYKSLLKEKPKRYVFFYLLLLFSLCDKHPYLEDKTTRHFRAAPTAHQPWADPDLSWATHPHPTHEATEDRRLLCVARCVGDLREIAREEIQKAGWYSGRKSTRQDKIVVARSGGRSVKKGEGVSTNVIT